MPKKKILTALAVVVVAAALAGSGFFFGFNAGTAVPKKIVVEGVGNAESQKPGEVNFDVFWQAWNLIDQQYLRSADVAGQKRVHGALKGLVGSLDDPYSEFFPPDENKKFQEDIRGNFGGIGAELGIKKERVVIVAPLKDTPASRAGLLAGDQILKINSTSTDGMSVGEAVGLIRGPVGATVTLAIFREGWEKPKDFAITRAVIMIPTLEAKRVGSAGNIAYIHLQSFNENAVNLFGKETSKALAEGVTGMILDLRDDPGGYLEVAVRLAGWFLPRGSLVVSEVGRNDAVFKKFTAEGNAALAHVPVVVLINGGSASASEILAGAFRDVRKTKLVGETSFGKGTVQQLQNLSDGSSMKLTVAHWVFPSGKILEKGGIKPDVEVKITEEDVKNKKDPQLDAAIRAVEEEIRAKHE